MHISRSSLLDGGFGKNFSTTTLQSEKAKKLVDEALAIDRDEANLKSVYAPKLTKVLPIRNAVRYLQIENKRSTLSSSMRLRHACRWCSEEGKRVECPGKRRQV